MGADAAIEREARLIILRELSSQPNRSMTSKAMRAFLLDMFLIDRTREWVEYQFEFLRQAEAVRVTPAGSIKVATLVERGLEHLRLKTFIAGVDSPTDPVA